MQQLTAEQVEKWRQAIRRDTFANYHYEMAVALERAGSREEAQASYRRAIDVAPDHFKSHARLIALLEGEGKTDLAAAARTQATTLCPDYQDRWVEEQAADRAQAALDRGDVEGAMAQLRPLPSITDRGALLWAAVAGTLRGHGRLDEAARCLTLAKGAAAHLPEVGLEEGLQAWARQDIDEAIRLIEPVYALMPTDGNIAAHLVWCHLVRLEAQAAVDLAAPHCSGPVSDIFLAEGYAAGLQLLGRYDEALAVVRAVPQFQDTANTDRWGLLCLIGRVQQAAGQGAAAVDTYQEALALSALSPSPQASLVARSYLGLGLLGLGDAPGALRQHELGTAAASPNAWILSNHALVLLALGRENEADKLLIQSLKEPDARQIPLRAHLCPQFRDQLLQRYQTLRHHT